MIIMDSETYRNEMIERINAEYDDEPSRRESFLSEIANELCELDQCDGFSPCHFDGSGPNNRRMGIDGYYYDEENSLDGSLSVFCCRYTGAEIPNVLIKTEIEKIYNRARNFIISAFDSSATKFIEYNTPPFFTAKMMNDKREEFQRFRIYIITDDVLSDRANRGLDIEFIDGKNTQVFVWDVNRCYSELISKRSNQDIEIVLENYGYDGINCVKANEISSGAEYDAYLCVVPGKLLADIYAKYGNRLLESNVRSFLSVKGKVNRGIRDSIKNEPTKFFAYNNGITTTASDVGVERTSDGLNITSIESLQIVNGGQTTASIYNATTGKAPVDVSEVFVPMKICVIPGDTSDELTRHISEYSNNQNKVGKSDFFSNAQFHIKIEKISRRLSAPPAQGSIYATKWYYERARGSYIQETLGKSASEIKAFQKENPKNQVMTKTDFARYRNTMELRPYDVSKAPETNFVKFGIEADALWRSTEIEGAAINDHYFKDTVGLAILYTAFHKLLSNKKIVPWMMSGEGKCLTSYSISRLILALNKVNCTINFNAIWNEQRAPDEMLNQLLEIASQIRSKLQIEIEGTSKNLFDYCKSEKAWILVKSLDIELHKEINPWVSSIGHEKSTTNRAKRAEKETGQIKNRIWVVQQSDEFWRKVMEWGMEHGKLNSSEISVLNAAANMNAKQKPPTERQCKWIKQIYDRMYDDGMDLDESS